VEGKKLKPLTDLKIAEESPLMPGVLERYATIPIAFKVASRFVVRPMEGGLGGLELLEEEVAYPSIKDYDALENEGPSHWCDTFDLSHWIAFTAEESGNLVGCALVAWNTPGVDMLEGRNDLAILWDLRVHPDYRGHGVGQLLFSAATAWAKERECRWLRIETQNINVPACRFYARQGCKLRSIHQGAYPELPDEVQLLWELAL
jgi:GNAT superfamily N-acetyltransferase